MNDRLITFGGAVLALLIIFLLLYQPTPPDAASRPVTEETKPNGYAAAVRWLQQASVPWVSSRLRLTDSLQDASLSDSGNILIITLPFVNPMREAEWSAVNDWVAQGNTLVVMAALNETPAWTLQSQQTLIEELRELSGFNFTELEDAEGEPILLSPELPDVAAIDFSGLPIFIEAQTAHPLFREVVALQGVTDYATHLWQPQLNEEMSFAVGLGRLRDHNSAALWQRQVGEGTILVSAFTSLFTNRGLAQAGNSTLFKNLIARHLQPGASVLFDDYHQGVSDLYDADAFFGDERLLATVAFVLGFWLVYLLGTSARYVRPREAERVARQQDLVAALSGFMNRKLTAADSGRLLVQNWLDELQRHGTIVLPLSEAGTADYAQAWSQLRSMPLLNPAEVAAVEQNYRRACAGQNFNLKQLHNSILALRQVLMSAAAPTN